MYELVRNIWIWITFFSFRLRLVKGHKLYWNSQSAFWWVCYPSLHTKLMVDCFIEEPYNFLNHCICVVEMGYMVSIRNYENLRHSFFEKSIPTDNFVCSLWTYPVSITKQKRYWERNVRITKAILGCRWVDSICSKLEGTSNSFLIVTFFTMLNECLVVIGVLFNMLLRKAFKVFSNELF